MDFEPGRCLGLQRKTTGVGFENGTMGQVRQTNKPYNYWWLVVFLDVGFWSYVLEFGANGDHLFHNTGRLAYHWDSWDCKNTGEKLGERRFFLIFQS